MAASREMEVVPMDVIPMMTPGPSAVKLLAPAPSTMMMKEPQVMSPMAQSPAPTPMTRMMVPMPSVMPWQTVPAPAPAPMEEAMPGCSLSSCASSVDNIFLMNFANRGGAIYVDDTSQSCEDDATGGAKIDVLNTRFENNSAVESGGAVFLGWRTAGAVGHIKSSDFVNNTATDAGGDITLDKALFNDTRGVELLAYDTQFSGMVLGPDGEPISQSVDVQALANATFSRCSFPTAKNPVLCGGSSCDFCPSQGGMVS
ncbi:hypothetical protein Mapa_004003 [Marchantia paleacea]|nr:hypothetical protein Mapa_004003 [Marchantia paleacea]